MNHKRRKIEEAIYQRVATAVEALLFPPTLNNVVEGMGNTTTGVEARVRENMLELHAVACDAEAARRALGLGAREAELLAERLSLPLVQEMPVSTRRFNEAGNEFLAVTRYRLAESAAWPGSAPDGWDVKPGPVVEHVEGDDRGRIVYHGNANRPYRLYIYPGQTNTPAAISTFATVQEAVSAFGPMLRQVKAQANTPPEGRATEARGKTLKVGQRLETVKDRKPVYAVVTKVIERTTFPKVGLPRVSYVAREEPRGNRSPHLYTYVDPLQVTIV